ncbi:hypothetical protein GUJ93_ZPchr0002g24784 [Zizania palustris]|uniref:Uncharacterized protein n=1 Tax=Zizania palustris TaxID=103762 RepID=A0A8J5SN55_ZIZPA|nr:hypothetical protein GUJ93_ZPchr0002g24784 [Zizania palustris]
MTRGRKRRASRAETVLEGWAKRMGFSSGAARRRASAAAAALRAVGRGVAASRVPIRVAMAAALWSEVCPLFSPRSRRRGGRAAPAVGDQLARPREADADGRIVDGACLDAAGRRGRRGGLGRVLLMSRRPPPHDAPSARKVRKASKDELIPNEWECKPDSAPLFSSLPSPKSGPVFSSAIPPPKSSSSSASSGNPKRVVQFRPPPIHQPTGDSSDEEEDAAEKRRPSETEARPPLSAASGPVSSFLPPPKHFLGL